MLTIRFLRAGRKNQAFFRIVLTESSKPAKSGFIKILGWYNPHSKENSLKKEEILSWLDKGAQPSNTLSKLLQAEGVKHKQIKFIPDAKKAPRKKEEDEKPKKPVAEEVGTEDEKPTEKVETKDAEAPQEDTEATAENKETDKPAPEKQEQDNKQD